MTMLSRPKYCITCVRSARLASKPNSPKLTPIRSSKFQFIGMTGSSASRSLPFSVNLEHATYERRHHEQQKAEKRTRKSHFARDPDSTEEHNRTEISHADSGEGDRKKGYYGCGETEDE